MCLFSKFSQSGGRLGYETLLLTEETGDEQLRSIIDTGMVDGVALMDVTMNDPRIELAQFSSIPLISIGHPMNEINVPCIDTDFIEMGEMIMQTLCRNGHSRILFAGGRRLITNEMEVQITSFDSGHQCMMLLRDTRFI